MEHVLYRRIAGSDSYRQEYTLTVLGYREGLQGLSNAGWRAPLALTRDVVDRQAEMGGALLPTSRWDEFVAAEAAERDALLTSIVNYLQYIDILPEGKRDLSIGNI